MKANRDRDLQAQQEGTARRRYSPPELVHYGDLSALTQGLGDGFCDGLVGSQPY